MVELDRAAHLTRLVAGAGTEQEEGGGAVKSTRVSEIKFADDTGILASILRDLCSRHTRMKEVIGPLDEPVVLKIYGEEIEVAG